MKQFKNLLKDAKKAKKDVRANLKFTIDALNEDYSNLKDNWDNLNSNLGVVYELCHTGEKEAAEILENYNRTKSKLERTTKYLAVLDNFKTKYNDGEVGKKQVMHLINYISKEAPSEKVEREIDEIYEKIMRDKQDDLNSLEEIAKIKKENYGVDDVLTKYYSLPDLAEKIVSEKGPEKKDSVGFEYFSYGVYSKPRSENWGTKI